MEYQGWVSTEYLGEHGVPGMGEQGVPVSTEYLVEHRVPGISEHGVPGWVSTECLGLESTEYHG